MAQEADCMSNAKHLLYVESNQGESPQENDLCCTSGRRGAALPHQRAESESDKQQQQEQECVVDKLQRGRKTNHVPINIFHWPLTVNRVAAVALIHKLVEMTVDFCFHDIAAAASDTKLPTGHVWETSAANQRGVICI